MTAEECLADIWGVGYVDEYFDEETLKIIRTYGQQQYRAGVEAMRDVLLIADTWEIIPNLVREEAARLLEEGEK